MAAATGRKGARRGTAQRRSGPGWIVFSVGLGVAAGGGYLTGIYHPATIPDVFGGAEDTGLQQATEVVLPGSGRTTSSAARPDPSLSQTPVREPVDRATVPVAETATNVQAEDGSRTDVVAAVVAVNEGQREEDVRAITRVHADPAPASSATPPEVVVPNPTAAEAPVRPRDEALVPGQPVEAARPELARDAASTASLAPDPDLASRTVARDPPSRAERSEVDAPTWASTTSTAGRPLDHPAPERLRPRQHTVATYQEQSTAEEVAAAIRSAGVRSQVAPAGDRWNVVLSSYRTDEELQRQTTLAERVIRSMR
jgi:hypothetical protein